MSELIATVEAVFDRDGRIKQSTLIPSVKNIIASEELLEFVHNLHSKSAPPIQVRIMGERLLSKYFSNVANMELFDNEKFYIDSEMLACEKYRSGVTKKCKIKFLFKQRG
jgi:hypothetical protein